MNYDLISPNCTVSYAPILFEFHCCLQKTDNNNKVPRDQNKQLDMCVAVFAIYCLKNHVHILIFAHVQNH